MKRLFPVGATAKGRGAKASTQRSHNFALERVSPGLGVGWMILLDYSSNPKPAELVRWVAAAGRNPRAYLMPVDATPWMKNRCRQMNRATMGAMTSTEPASSSP